MLPTPATSHVNFDRVYEPAEDSYLLLDTLSSTSESSFLKARFPPNSPQPVVLEVGTGSGVVLAFVTANIQSIMGRCDVKTMGVDINRFACQATNETVRQACDAVVAQGRRPANYFACFNRDLLSSFVAGSLDVVIFNPPYVPTDEAPPPATAQDMVATTADEIFKRDSQLLALSYAGGADGMETTNRLLAQLPTALSRRGVAYILLCAQNRPEEVRARVQAWPNGWAAEIVGSSGKKAGWEKLSILRIWQPGGTSRF